MTFVEIGGNAEVFKAVASGTVDAGPSSVVSFYYQSRLGVHSLTDGDMWSELPDFTYQLMYASDRAIAEKREAIVRTLAAHEDLFGFLQAPGSWEAYRKARAEALPRRDAAEAQAVWRFIQEQRPYGRDLAISDARLRYLQRLDASLRVIRRPMPPESVADMSMARDAIRLRG